MLYVAGVSVTKHLAGTDIHKEEVEKYFYMNKNLVIGKIETIAIKILATSTIHPVLVSP
jgi:hypothetical protein